jgi:hypothetical protein
VTACALRLANRHASSMVPAASIVIQLVAHCAGACEDDHTGMSSAPLPRLQRPHKSWMLLAVLVPPVTKEPCGRNGGPEPSHTARTCRDPIALPRS